MMRIVQRGGAIVAACYLIASPAASMQATVSAPDLATLFAPAQGLVRDTNGDALPDDVAARVIVPGGPVREESVAAANIAARLGFETTAMSLPVVLRDNEVRDPAGIGVPILVGHTNAFVRQLVERAAIDLTDLEAGQGLIAVVHSPLGGGTGLVVAGNDPEGTLAAATELAARLPRLWNMTGITINGVSRQVTAYLRRSGVDARTSAVTQIVVDRERRGLATVTVRTPLPAAHVARAQRALEDLARAHRRGLEPGTLNFAEVAQTTVQLVADGTVASIASVSRSGLNPRTLTPPIDPRDLAPDSPGERGRPADTPAGGRGKVFDLTNLFSIDGWYGDAYTDLIPDRTDASIVVGPDDDALGAAHIAARLGLETTGITLPIARLDDDVRDPAREPSAILVGRNNRLVRDLEKIGHVRLDDLQPGEGAIQVVPNAFGTVTATTIAGGDAAGTEAASMYLARRLPYVWDNARGSVSLDDVRTDVARFLEGRSAAGQASQAWSELTTLLRSLEGQDVESFDAKLFLERADPAFDTFLRERLSAALAGARISVTSEAVTAAVPVIDETIEVPWEVDEVRTRIRDAVLPMIKPGTAVHLEVRVSESPEVRRTLSDELRQILAKAGAADPQVRVLSAYKQGFLWLTEQVIPELKGKGVRSVHIAVAELTPDLSKPQKFYQVPSRWIHELYPVDEIFTRELGLARDQFHLELVDAPKDIYTLEARDGSGRVVHTARFSPTFAPREYLDKFPGWATVDVTTGWLTAIVGGARVLDTRIETDPERFWNHYQSKVLPQIYEHVMRVTENQPLPAKQPFFRDLDIEVRMSEPDFRIGVDEELISSLESLHEDLYFVTLDFFDALGRTTIKQRLAGPGKVFPIIHPERRGQPGQVRVLYAGNASTKAVLQVRYQTKGGGEQRVNRDLGRIDTTRPAARRVIARVDGVSEIAFGVEAKDDANAARAADALEALGTLHDAGLFRTALSLQHVDRIAVDIALQHAGTRRVVGHSGQWAPSNVRASSRPAVPLVTWDHVIGPDESEEIIGRLAAFPEIRAYRAGRSYRGRQISVIEATLPATGEIVSLAKLTALKPTILITGRQHANEVSSTSHILKLAESLATDPEYRRLLEKVNIVLHPVENPDGAQMAYELQKLTPTHMLHAGRYSALGMDVASQVGVADPLLPEALIRGRLWHEWLPDIYLNPHGYPSHEWVQRFAGYVSPGFRSYWTTRGWYTSVGGLRDPRYPAHGEAIAAIREAIVREINSDTRVRDMNLRHQARYRRWAHGVSPYVYPQEIYKKTAIYHTDPETGEARGQRRARPSTRGAGRWSMNAWPQVTFISGGTEAPDETAQGEWLDLVTKPGFSYLMAHIRYLRDGRYRVDRIEENAPRDAASLTLLRVRPVRPPGRQGRSTTSQ